MIKHKKYIFSLIFFCSLGLLVFGSEKAFADPVTPANFTSGQYQITRLENDRPATIRATIAGTVFTFTDSNTDDTHINLKTDGRVAFICGQRTRTAGITLQAPPTTLPSGARQYTGHITVNYSTDTEENQCGLDEDGNATYRLLYEAPIRACYPNACAAQTPGNQTPEEEEPTCEGNSGGLGWIFCPIISMIDKIVTTLYDLVEEQLCFKAGVSTTDGGNAQNVCESGNMLTANVERAWSIMKNLATVILVLIMLVIVISQALNWGPLDAYTVRRALPKLVAAVILIQISWVLAKFAIDLTNDIGLGLKEIMYAPFPANIDDIGVALGRIGATGMIAGTGLILGGVAALAFSGLTIVGIAIIGLTVLAALLVGFLVLMFRNVLIIMCVIFIPLALAAWILPGTDRYWKLWRETFVKLLMMFPLIVGLIAAGRIFGFIAGGSAGDSNAAQIVALLAVLVGFFGPLFILPKTFQWGGTALNSIGGAVINGSRGLRRKPYDYAMGQAKINRAQREADRNERMSYGRGRTFDRFLAAAPGMGLNSRSRDLRLARQTAEGREAGEKAVAQALIGSEYETMDHDKKLKSLVLLAQGQNDPDSKLSGKNPAMQRWALDQLATYGDWDKIDALRASGNVDERTWQSFVAKNISAIHQNTPYLSPIRRDMSQISAEESTTWKDWTAQEFVRQIAHGKKRTADGKGWEDVTDPEERAAQLRNGINIAKTALGDERIRSRLTPTMVSAFEQVSALETPNVSVVQDRMGRVQGVHLPRAELIGSDKAVQGDVTRHLVSQGAEAKFTRSALASQLANPDLGNKDRQALEAYLLNFKQQAMSSNSPDMVAAYKDVHSMWEQGIQARVQQAEKRSVEVGKTGPQVIEDKNNAQAAANRELSRLQSLGFTRIP